MSSDHPQTACKDCSRLPCWPDGRCDFHTHDHAKRQPQPACDHAWWQRRDGKPPKCAKCGERKQAYAEVEAERDRYRAALEEIREVELPYEKSWVIAGDVLGIDGGEDR